MKAMKATKLILPLVLLGLAGAAHAGKTGAGPAGGKAGPGVGSLVNPGSSVTLNTPGQDMDGNALLPGDAGRITLIGAQLTQAASVLTAAQGAVVNGPIIRVPTVLGDGGAAVVVLNTETGELLIVRED